MNILCKDFIYRRANIDDFPQVAKVLVQTTKKSFIGILPQGHLKNLSVEKQVKLFWREFFNKKCKIFVAENEENRIVGFAEFGKSRGDFSEYKRQLYSFYILPEFQRKGIGNKLFQSVVNEMINEGFTSMYLATLKESVFQNFYKKMNGFILGETYTKIAEQDILLRFYGWKDLTKL